MRRDEFFRAEFVLVRCDVGLGARHEVFLRAVAYAHFEPHRKCRPRHVLFAKLCAAAAPLDAERDGLAVLSLHGEDERRAEELIASHIASLWEKCRASGCDLFLLARELYRKDPKAFEANPGLIPSGMEADIEVSVKGAD